MKQNVFVILFFISLLSAQGLMGQSKYGNSSIAELEMSSYPQDTTASAVVLSKVASLRFSYNERVGFVFLYEQQMKIKILKPEGLGFADNQIEYYEASNTSKEDVKGLSGTTYNLVDGKIEKTKLTKEHIFDEDTGEKWKVKKFTMPATKVGSVIEYKYAIESPFLYELRDFYFQASIPIDYVKFEARIPEYFVYNQNQQGYISLDKYDKKPVNEQFSIRYHDDNGRMQSSTLRCTADDYIFEGTKVPSAKAENKLWTIKDYISKVSFELRQRRLPYEAIVNYSSSWNNIDKELFDSNSFGANLKRAGWFKNDVEKGELTLAKASEIEQMIKSRVQWDNTNRSSSNKLKDALNKGIGSSADINFLLINALGAAGFEAYPVLLSTRSNGRVPMGNPSITAFNNTITALKIDTMMYYTDASSKYSSWNILPEKCVVTQARLMNPAFTSWVDLTKVSTGTVFKQGTLEFIDGAAQLKVNESRAGNDAYNARSAYKSYADQDKFIEAIEAKEHCVISDFEIEGIDNNGETLKIQYVETKDIDLDSEFIYYAPPLDKLYSENPFTKEERTFPVNFDYLQNHIQMFDIKIPEGYEVVELPQTAKFIMPNNDLTFLYRIVQQGDILKVHSQFQVRNLLFLPTDYEYLKDFFGKMILKNSEQIVLKKI